MEGDDADVDALNANKNFYWTLKGVDSDGTVVSEEAKYQTTTDLIDAIKALSGDASGTKEYAANTLPET